MNAPRIAPLDPPYAPETEALFRLVMPEGVDPLVLFRTLARSDRVFPRFMRAGVLDPGPVPIEDRELVILRTTARCGSEYEWGVHVVAFARPLFTDDQIEGTRTASPDDPRWSASQALLLRLCDDLHDHQTVDDELWSALSATRDDAQLTELVYLVGLYTAVSYLTNALRLPLEPFGERFP